ncbi:DNA repair protein RecO [Deinococcus irradiatisoli]|uniref:DNA repair protein RecO n=1 Tax=Deinococcus irradiatisoli TaxID=2202254 RepID=A0A2Z3JMD4_9DEIO|nr:DNA repair protein RecO [Deinococcus irradiatisoli]AWN22858.1 DNA repair protein RecO [Deinococcus irradiatisoli]
MRSRSANRSGIVMRRRVTPAGDIIVTLLTPQGKIKAIARGGVRGSQASRLNLFHHVGVQLYQTPQADLATVQQSVLEGALPRLSEPERHPYAHLLSELADALFQEGEFSEQAFELYAGALRGVSHHPDPEWVTLVMSYKLLSLAGFAPRSRQCARCAAPDPAHPDPLGGQLLCGACSSQPPHPAERLEFLREVPRRSVRALMDQPLPAEQRPGVWRSLERFVTVQIGGVQSWRSLASSLGGEVVSA